MRIGSNRRQVSIFGNQTIGGTDKFVSQSFGHSLHSPILP